MCSGGHPAIFQCLCKEVLPLSDSWLVFWTVLPMLSYSRLLWYFCNLPWYGWRPDRVGRNIAPWIQFYAVTHNQWNTDRTHRTETKRNSWWDYWQTGIKLVSWWRNSVRISDPTTRRKLSWVWRSKLKRDWHSGSEGGRECCWGMTNIWARVRYLESRLDWFVLIL